MSRDTQQIVRVVQSLFRKTRGRMPLKWTLLLGVLLIGYLFAQPYLERVIGVSLPGIASSGEQAAPPAGSTTPSGGQPADRSSGQVPDVRPAANIPASSVLTDVGRGVFESPAGLRYNRSRQDDHRLNHIMRHAKDQPNRPGQHGVFDTDDLTQVVLLLDEAYEQALAGQRTKTSREAERVVYDVNLGRRIGYVGGESGNRRGKPAARHLRLVLQGKNVITAFPVRP